MWKICLFSRFLPSLERQLMDDKNTAPSYTRASRVSKCWWLCALDFETPCSSGKGNHAMRHWQPTVFVCYFNGIPWKCIVQCAVSTTINTRKAIGYTSVRNWNDPVIYRTEEKKTVDTWRGNFCVKWATHTNGNTHCLTRLYCFHFPRSPTFTYPKTKKNEWP